jgi:hypothetical protein
MPIFLFLTRALKLNNKAILLHKNKKASKHKPPFHSVATPLSINGRQEARFPPRHGRKYLKRFRR